MSDGAGLPSVMAGTIQDGELRPSAASGDGIGGVKVGERKITGRRCAGGL